MPKSTEKPVDKAHRLAREHRSDGIEADGLKLMCRNCGIFIGTSIDIRKCQIDQHIKSMKHKKNAELKAKHTTPIDAGKPKPYTTDLCRAFISADIPLYKLYNPELSEFLEQYTNFKTPSESTIRKNYVEAEYNRTLDMIREEIGDGPIWISIDETTDAQGRFIANVIVGKMSTEVELNKCFLFHCVELSATNSETIAKIFTEAVFKLWPVNTPSKMDQVFLFVTDAAPYMVKAAKNLKTLYTRMIHVTCAAHGIHRVCETIRSEFQLTNTIISAGKKVFLKAPYRVQLLKSMYLEMPLPPQPIITRWGTWLKAAEYYADYLFEMVEVLRALDDDSEAIKTAKETIEMPELVSELTTIKLHYVCLTEIITKLESSKLTLIESVDLVERAETKLSCTANKKIKAKFTDVFKKNIGLQALSALAHENTAERLKIDIFKLMSPSELACFKYATIVSVQVERSFSIYKNLLTDRRRNLKVTSLSEYLIIACYNSAKI